VDLATQYNPGYRQTQNNHGPAVWGVRNAYASFLPTFSVSGRASYSGAGTQNFLTTSFQQPSATIGSGYSMGFNLTLNGRTFLQPSLSQAQLRAADATIEGAEINLESTVRGQYLAVLEAQAQVNLADLEVTRNEEFLRLAQARYEVGQNTILDVRQAEVSLGRAEVDRLMFRQAVIVEKLRLFQQMGVPAPEDPSVVVLTDTFSLVAQGTGIGSQGQREGGQIRLVAVAVILGRLVRIHPTIHRSGPVHQQHRQQCSDSNCAQPARLRPSQ
jgi:outer membrane protein TolC